MEMLGEVEERATAAVAAVLGKLMRSRVGEPKWSRGGLLL